MCSFLPVVPYTLHHWGMVHYHTPWRPGHSSSLTSRGSTRSGRIRAGLHTGHHSDMDAGSDTRWHWCHNAVLPSHPHTNRYSLDNKVKHSISNQICFNRTKQGILSVIGQTETNFFTDDIVLSGISILPFRIFNIKHCSQQNNIWLWNSTLALILTFTPFYWVLLIIYGLWDCCQYLRCVNYLKQRYSIIDVQ